VAKRKHDLAAQKAPPKEAHGEFLGGAPSYSVADGLPPPGGPVNTAAGPPPEPRPGPPPAMPPVSPAPPPQAPPGSKLRHFRLLGGDYHDRNTGVIYHKGLSPPGEPSPDVVVPSYFALDEMFANKFVRLDIPPATTVTRQAAASQPPAEVAEEQEEEEAEEAEPEEKVDYGSDVTDAFEDAERFSLRVFKKGRDYVVVDKDGKRLSGAALHRRDEVEDVIAEHAPEGVGG
jgi:hypothetical protein